VNHILNWLSSHKFESNVISFLLMILPPVGLFYAAQAGSTGFIYALLALVVAGNLLAVATR